MTDKASEPEVKIIVEGFYPSRRWEKTYPDRVWKKWVDVADVEEAKAAIQNLSNYGKNALNLSDGPSALRIVRLTTHREIIEDGLVTFSKSDLAGVSS